MTTILRKAFYLTYAFASYAFFFAAFLYFIAFTGNYFVPVSVDVGPEGPLLAGGLTNLLWIAIFGLQHTVMARPAFKKVFTRIVPEPIERATYVFLSTAILCGLMYFWTPITGTIWTVSNPIGAAILHGVFAIGVLTILASTFIIDHFELFGLKQVFLDAFNKIPAASDFKVSFLYTLCRHPLMLGWIIMLWAAPVFTVGHALLAGGMTAYIYIALVFEERDLVAYFGDKYRQYQQDVPKMFPFTRPRRNRGVVLGKTQEATQGTAQGIAAE